MSELPRGLRNRNPGNIRRSAVRASQTFLSSGLERGGGRLTICSDAASTPSVRRSSARMGSSSSACSPRMTVLSATSYSWRMRSALNPEA